MPETVVGRAVVEILPKLERFGQETNQQVKSAMAGTKETFEKPFRDANKGIRQDFKQTSTSVKKEAGGLGRSIKGLLAPAVTAFSVLGAIDIGKESINAFKDTATEVLRLQRVAGGTAEEMSRLRFAAEHSGVSVGSLTNGLKLFGRNLVSAQGSAKKTADITHLLGFNFQDAHGKILPMSTLLPKVADVFKNMPNGPQKTALAMKLFGRSGADLIPVLNKGSAGLKELGAESDKFGTTLSGKQLTALTNYKKQQREFGATMLGVKLAIGGALLPVMTRLGEGINKFIGQMRDGTGAGGLFAGVFRTMADAVKGSVGFIKDHTRLVKGLAIAIIGVMAITKAFTAVQAAQNAIMAAGGIIGYLKNIKLVQVATKIWAGVQWLLNVALDANPIGIIVIAIAALVAGIIIAYKHSATFRKVVTEALDAVKKAFDTVKAKIVDVAHWFGQLPGKVASAIGDTAKSLYKKGADFITGLMNGIMSIAKGIGNWMLRAPVVKVVAPWLFAGLWLVKHGKALMEGFKNGVVAVAKTVGTWFNTHVIKPVIVPFLKAGLWLVQHGKNLLGGLLNGILAIMRTVGTWERVHIINPVVGAFKLAGTWLVQHGRNLIAGLQNGITSIARSIGRWAYDHVIVPVVRPFGAAGKWLVSHGAALISGLLGGISGALKNIGKWVNDHVVQPIIKNVKTFFGISSPSTVFAGIGGHLMAGLFKGMSAHDIGKVVVKIFGSMPKALGKIVGKGLISIGKLPKKALDALGLVAGAIDSTISVPLGTGMSKLVQTVAQSFGWGSGSEWNSLYQLVMHESGFRPNAQNPTSSAYGLFQFLDSTWGSVGATKTSDPTRQTIAGLKYIKQAYGSPNQAWAAWQLRSPHWYAKGTPWVPEDQLAVVHKGEAIVPAEENTAGKLRQLFSSTRGRDAGTAGSGPDAGGFELSQRSLMALAALLAAQLANTPITLNGRLVSDAMSAQALGIGGGRR
jgi:hypothetical protein